MSSKKEIYTDQLGQRWYSDFSESTHFSQLNEEQQDRAEFIIDTFLSYMTRSFDESIPAKWTIREIEDVFLDYAPGKISGEIGVFEAYGDVVAAFFTFLQETEELPKKPELIERTLELKHIIVEKAKDSSNWGFAKSMVMNAMEEGYDMSKSEDMDEYMAKQQMSALQNLTGGKSKKPKKREYKVDNTKKRSITRKTKRGRRRK